MNDNKLKNDIEEQDITELKKKRIKSKIKNTIIGIIITGSLVSTVPNIEFYGNLFFSKHNHDIVDIVESNNYCIKEKAEILLEKGLAKNKHLSDQEKSAIKDSFEKYVIEEYSDSFTEKYLYNMYVSAKTVDMKYITDFIRKYSWWDGDFNSYFNDIYVPAGIEKNKELLAHEFLHASLKKGLFGTGLTSGIQGYGFNEGLTASHVMNDPSYFDEYCMVSYIGCLLGIDKVERAYFNGDLNSIEQELNKYLSNEETKKLISNCDKIVFISYLNEFLIRLGIDSSDTYYILLSKYEKETIELMKKVFVNKTGLSLTDSSYGRLLFGKGSMGNSDDINEPFYYITFADSNNYLIEIHYYHDFEYYYESYIVHDLSNFDIDKAMEDIIKTENNSATNRK